jgi:hypothetical protein
LVVEWSTTARQSSDLINDIIPAAEVVKRLLKEFELARMKFSS